MILLVCGGRDYDNESRAFSVLDSIQDITRIINGGAQGADLLARRWARNRGVECVTFKADWKEHGKAAGPIRNQRMIDEGKPDGVLAFPGGKGTQNMVELAIKADLPVKSVDWPAFGIVNQWAPLLGASYNAIADDNSMPWRGA
jgi:hypothetical protein